MRPDVRKRKQREDGESCLMTRFCFLNLVPNIKVIQCKKIRDGRGLQDNIEAVLREVSARIAWRL